MLQSTNNTNIAVKVCGMKYNAAKVAALKPNYLGFIFYDGSPRNYTGPPSTIPSEIKKVGVFVNASFSFVKQISETHKLDVIQLHGEETVEYITDLTTSLPSHTDIWKVFSIKDSFNFELLKPFEPHVDAFLFDTKGEARGGNGVHFNWDVLEAYPSTKPFVLSGGIGIADLSEVKKLINSGLPVLAIDINSKFEIQPGRKDIDLLKRFMHQLHIAARTKN